jgi:hypothetical protein
VGIKQLLAKGTRKRLRFVVIRPRDQSLVKSALDKLKPLEGTYCLDEFQATMHGTLKSGGIFVGCLKPKCRKLFNFDGTPSPYTLQPGDIIDDMEEFRKALENGAYLATGEHFNPGDEIQSPQVTEHESRSTS